VVSMSNPFKTALFAMAALALGTASQSWGVTYTAIDLTPSGFDNSFAYGISGTQQVGGGSGSATGGNQHALLWSGSAASFVDLNPSGLNINI